MARARRSADPGDDLDDEIRAPVLDAGDLDLEDEEFPDIVWTVKRILTPEQQQTMGTRETESFVTKFRGPLDLATVQQQLGGGRFHFYGKVGRQIVKSPTITIEGEYRQVRVAPEPNGKDNASLSVPDRTLSVEDQVRRAVARERRRHRLEIERQEREAERKRADERFAHLEQLIVQAAAQKPTGSKTESVKELIEGIVLLKQLAPEGASMNPLELLAAAREWQNQGIVLGEKREPGTADGGDGWNAERITAIAQAVAQVMSRITPRQPVRPAAQPGAASPNPQASTAEVVEPAAAKPSDPLHRWRSAVETVSRNMLRGRGPEDTAATIEDLLNEEELRNLKGQEMEGVWRPTATEALQWLEAQGVGKFPQLEHAGGLVYLESVLAELRKPDEPE